MNNDEVVEVQLDRSIRASNRVVARCPLGLPVVVAVPPVLDDGTPFPTRYWLTCPLARIRTSRLESAGGVRAMDRRAAQDEVFAARLARAHARYAAERDALIPQDAPRWPSGGVAGSRSVKCLHAHVADALAGNENPVGELVVPWVLPLNCSVPCVVEGDSGAMKNIQWREPR